MAFEFEFVGGVAKPNFHDSAKFLLFFVIDGQEVPFYQLRRDGLIMKVEELEERYATSHNIVKIFISSEGYSIPRRFYSFYLELKEGPFPIAEVKPFPEVQQLVPYYFKAKATFLTKKQILKVLGEENESRMYVRRQEMLPLDTLRRMCSLDRRTMREGIRHVRIGKKKAHQAT